MARPDKIEKVRRSVGVYFSPKDAAPPPPSVDPPAVAAGSSMSSKCWSTSSGKK